MLILGDSIFSQILRWRFFPIFKSQVILINYISFGLVQTIAYQMF
jgi:hypothetical protein